MHKEKEKLGNTLFLVFFVRVLEYEIFSPKCFEIFVKKIKRYFFFTVKNLTRTRDNHYTTETWLLLLEKISACFIYIIV